MISEAKSRRSRVVSIMRLLDSVRDRRMWVGHHSYWEENRRETLAKGRALYTKHLGLRSKLETQIIQLDFDDLRAKHLIEVSESIRLYTSEYGYSLEDVADVLGIPVDLCRRDACSFGWYAIRTGNK